MNIHEITSTEIDQRGMRTFEPRWMRQQRMQAWQQYQDQDFPNWKKTKTPKLDLDASLRLEYPEEPQPITVERQVPKGTSGRIVLIDDQLFRVSLKKELAYKGVIFCDMQTAILERADLLERYLKDRRWGDEDKLTSFQKALWNNGFFLFIPAGLQVEEPFQVEIVQRDPRRSIMARSAVIMDEGSCATLEERYFSESNASETTLCCDATEVFGEAGSQLEYLSVQNWGAHIYEEGYRNIDAKRDARVNFLHTLVGGKAGHIAINGDATESGARIDHRGILVGRQQQRFKIVPEMKHYQGHTEGFMRYKGILKDEAYAFLDGLIQVTPTGRQSQSRLEEETLLLSEKAHCDALPALDIQTDQVQVSHAASVRQADREQLFYLMSRGLDRQQAQNMIIEGFFEDLLAGISRQELYQSTKDLITEKLAQ